MQTINAARETLTWAANRLAEAHRDITLEDNEFQEFLETFLLTARAYHQAIRDTNLSIQKEGPRPL